MAITISEEIMYMYTCIHNVYETHSKILLSDLTATIANIHFKACFQLCDNVARYIDFKDGDKRNVNPNHFTLAEQHVVLSFKKEFKSIQPFKGIKPFVAFHAFI